MTASTRLPHYFHPREGKADTRQGHGETMVDAINRQREQVEVQLDPDTVELDIVYEDRNLSLTSRRIKPIALTALGSSELALIAICRLREEQRCFAVSRIQEARFPGFPSKPLTGDELMDWLQPDVQRLIEHDASVNGTVIRPARPYPAIAEQHRLADMEISEGVISMAEMPETVRSAPALLTSLADAIDRFAKAIRPKASRKQTAITITMERRDGALRVYVDTNTEIAQTIRDGSNHARMAFLGARAPIEAAAAELYVSLAQDPMIGHEDLTLRVALKRGGPDKTTGLWLAIDGNWVNTEPNAGSTLATKLRNLLKRMNALPEITPMGDAPPEWMLNTTRGVFQVRAPRAEEAVLRLLVLGAVDVIDVLAIAQVIESNAAMQQHMRPAA